MMKTEKFYITKCDVDGKQNDPDELIAIFDTQDECEAFLKRRRYPQNLDWLTQDEFDYVAARNGVLR